MNMWKIYKNFVKSSFFYTKKERKKFTPFKNYKKLFETVEKLLKVCLGMHYRVSSSCSTDCSFPAKNASE